MGSCGRESPKARMQYASVRPYAAPPTDGRAHEDGAEYMYLNRIPNGIARILASGMYVQLACVSPAARASMMCMWLARPEHVGGLVGNTTEQHSTGEGVQDGGRARARR